MNIRISGGVISQEEINAYIEHGRKAFPDKVITAIDIKLDGEFADIDYHLDDVAFQRIRRITGYLVGDLSRFNNAKRREVDDRVKHFRT